MASGVPLIVSDIPSLVSVTGREHVTVFEPDSFASLIASIELVKKSLKVKAERANKLAHKVNYTWTNRARKIIDFLTNGV